MGLRLLGPASTVGRECSVLGKVSQHPAAINPLIMELVLPGSILPWPRVLMSKVPLVKHGGAVQVILTQHSNRHRDSVEKQRPLLGLSGCSVWELVHKGGSGALCFPPPPFLPICWYL